MRWIKRAIIVTILSAIVSINYQRTAVKEADTNVIIVPAILDRPTNVVSDLSTMCSESDQFGFIVRHSVIYSDHVLDVTKLCFEVNNSTNVCHTVKETPSYKLEGYFDTDSESSLFTIGVGPLFSAWTGFDTQLYNTPLGKFVKDATAIDQRLQYADDILSGLGDYWTRSFTRSNFGTYFTCDSDIVPSLNDKLSVSTEIIDNVKVTVFVPNDDIDVTTYKVMYTVYYTQNSVDIEAEVFYFEVLTDVVYVWDPDINEVNTARNTDVFEYVYDYIMR